MKRYFLWFLVVFLSLTNGYHILKVWRGMVLSQKAASKETLLKAIEADPDEYFFYLWEWGNINPS